MQTMGNTMRCDQRAGEVARLKEEIAALRVELDEAIAKGEGGDQTLYRDLITEKQRRICELTGEKFIEVY
ncbi:MAG: hypothetical protein UY41_C0010G0002 [Candidatus Moranbacteria bacterium GW2011_GWE1_49_15]|nr:MAG: hypothetical protein UX75_C0031G0002 [Candidatus Moranbacteria bacterium GW2011_GWE2_47_10]KKW07013.1 MAG: hypothetical protein UY41_C0010G0002 [Candidatus Moranbacteria bacterium GW2011_GWE1_49_15]HBP01486.1 hypothetical protein [Candidatus Moranbacteria bacterium]